MKCKHVYTRLQSLTEIKTQSDTFRSYFCCASSPRPTLLWCDV